MAKDGLIRLLCAGLLVGAVAEMSALWATGEDKADAVAATLAVHTALQQGHDFLQKGDRRSAVLALESQLARINGNPTYLAVLRDAYRAYVKELRLAKQDAEAQRYLQRLQILDPGAALDAKAATPALAAVAPAAVGSKTPPPPAAANAEPKIRLIREDEEAAKSKAE